MSDVPELIEPVTVVIERIDKDNTQYSGGISGRHEHFNNVARKVEITVPAQVVFGDDKMMTRFTAVGADEGAKGYCVFRYQDINEHNLARGDKIIKLGQLDVEYYLLHTTGDPAAHFSSIGGFTLTRMFFGDRNPIGGN